MKVGQGLKPGMQTIAVHGGKPDPLIEDAIVTPIFQSSTYLLGTPEEFDDIRYIRLNNTPNHSSLTSKVAALEGTEDAVVTPSGTSAISVALLSYLEKGDHIIAPKQIYGGTRKILDDLLSRFGIETTYVSFEEVGSWEASLRPSTKVLYLESVTNPFLDIPPLDQLAQFSQAHRLVSMVDNTLPSPVNYRPAEMNFDVVIHSASKSLNGHTDIVAGAIAGAEADITRIRKMMNLSGVCLDPNACYLLERGLKTLPLRVRAQNQNALALATALEQDDRVRHVRYPGLVGDSANSRAKQWFGGFGGMVSFVPHGGLEEAERVLARLKYAHIAPSLGGVETLVSRPATTSHAGLSEQLRHSMGVPDDMIRVSVGIEDAEDIIDDFRQALAK